MSDDKVIDLDPRKRLTKEALARIQTTVASFKVKDVENLIILYTKSDGGTSLEAFGVDWSLLGISEAYLESLRASLLEAEGGYDDVLE